MESDKGQVFLGVFCVFSAVVVVVAAQMLEGLVQIHRLLFGITHAAGNVGTVVGDTLHVGNQVAPHEASLDAALADPQTVNMPCSQKPDMQFCRSLETGVITMNNDIIRRVGALHDMQIEDEHISAVLAGKETILPEEVKDTIRKSAEQHAINILNQLRELKVDLRSNPAVFIGGGSALFRDYLEKSPLVASATFVESVNANAIGYQAMAEGQLSLQRA